jgi:trehalose 6-phosphate phosphatase
VLEIRPRVAWSKGHAVVRLLKSSGYTRSQCVVYIGDDRTDEDAFRLLPSQAVTIRVGKHSSSSAAFWVISPLEVRKFLELVDSMNKNNKVH